MSSSRKEREEEERFPVTPSKGKNGSPLKRNIRLIPDNEGDSDNDESDPDKTFYCRLAVDSRRGLFYGFGWEHHRQAALLKSKPPAGNAGPSSQNNDAWSQGSFWDLVEKEKKASAKASARKVPVKARAVDISESEADDSDEFRASEEDSNHDEEEDAADMSVSEDGEAEDDDDEPDFVGTPHTPSRKRKRIQTTITPRKGKRSKNVVQPTPHSKAALARRKKATSSPRKRKTFAIRLPEQSLRFQANMAHIPKDPWLRSMHALHVGSRPDSLPCREAEYERVLRCVGELLEEGSGGCICKTTPNLLFQLYPDYSNLQIFQVFQELVKRPLFTAL